MFASLTKIFRRPSVVPPPEVELYCPSCSRELPATPAGECVGSECPSAVALRAIMAEDRQTGHRLVTEQTDRLDEVASRLETFLEESQLAREKEKSVPAEID